VIGLGVTSIARADEFVTTCGPDPNEVFAHAAVFGINTIGRCPNPPYSGGGLAITTAANHVARGRAAHWQASAPSGLAIVGASVPQGSLVSAGVNDGQQYGGGFYWAGGGAQTRDAEPSVSLGGFSSSYFGFQLVCGVSTCTTGIPQLNVGQITLQVRETSGPILASPDGLWQARGWVRGDWTLNFYGDSPSGLCSLSASINGQPVSGSLSAQDVAVWHQCNAPAVRQTVHTWAYGQGPMPLTLRGSDAAGVSTSDPSYTRTIYVDNSQPTVSMSGPTVATSDAGVQYVTATAGGSPSEIDGIACSVDGAPAHWYPGASTQVPVTGVGQHLVRCTAANNAVDGAGDHGWSQTADWSLKIADPTISAIAFTRIVDALRCRRVRERVQVPARWVSVRRHHRLVHILKGAHTKVVTVTRCHPRTERRRVTVWVTIRRHGKRVRVKRTKIVQVVVPPRTVGYTTRRVAYGRRTTVNGWVGTANGMALVGQPVVVFAAVDNGRGNFRPAALAITRADGSWSAQLGPGPSRRVAALYPGSGATAPAISGQVRVVVPAVVRLYIKPRAIPWGGTIQIFGRVLGGYIPGARQQLLRLRIGAEGISGTVGIPEVQRNGHFSTTWTFHPGVGVVDYWFTVSTLNEADYAYAPGSSPRVTVTVGPG
jgi:hypothetical protein